MIVRFGFGFDLISLILDCVFVSVLVRLCGGFV